MNPGENFKMIGVTGTNGKTTVQWIIYNLLERLGTPAFRLGTLGFQAPGLKIDTSLTSPDPLSIYDFLRKGREAGAKAGVMEISSHALDQYRAHNVFFNIGVFTNLSQDHLDYHGNLEDYFLAKVKLLDLVLANAKDLKYAVSNIDDEYGKRFLGEANKRNINCLSFGFDQEADLRIVDFSQSITGSSFSLLYDSDNYPIETTFIGRYNAENFAAAVATCLQCGFEFAQVCEKLADLPAVPGRLEPVGNQEIGVYVDYSHTPDALKNALIALQEIVENKLWVIYGCGGDRDKGKRPQMAAIAQEFADKAVLTSDNPRTEDPNQIIQDCLSQGARADLIEVDRRSAIQKTIELAEPGDVVLIAGKGHEDYQILGTEKIHFSDQEEVRKILAV